jgi:hypothetical protein
MSKANYALCEGCDNKAFYTGEDDLPEGIVVWHEACLAKSRKAELDPVRNRPVRGRSADLR